ncbi:phage tail tube protein [Ligilactobacillus apodemi]|uniref:phage tail tube protein n=1 Tax=Ligilactobacillus apodemi TaxID=307126 RepID=UPI00214CCAEE|nr:capsid protein [Ligilactobacillus apodemi]MCR1902292.1 capsid protein [Ligilactobacillus apodemi]
MAINTTPVAGSEPVNDGFLLNSTNQYYIDTTGGTNLDDLSDAKFARLAAGISSITPAGNETASNDAYYDGGAFGSNDITGKRPQWTCSGHRLVGDKAQDYIASKEFVVGESLKTRFLWVNSEGEMIVSEVTMMTIVASGGNANAKQTFSFVLGMNGAPVVPNGKPQIVASGEDGLYKLADTATA